MSTTNGATLYTIETTDAESDQLTYSIACDPVTCPIDTAPKGNQLAESDQLTYSKARNPNTCPIKTALKGNEPVGSDQLTHSKTLILRTGFHHWCRIK